jgi:hypothetical protein
MVKKGDDKKGESSKITFGGWYQRTTLHLTEVYEFLKNTGTRLQLSKARLRKYHEKLNLKNVSRELGNFEYIKAETKDGIVVRYYEDGLYVLETEGEDIERASRKLKQYFEKNWKSAIEYLFSLGSPTPKTLSNLKDEHPVVISKISRDHKNFQIPRKYGKVYSETHFQNISVYKTEDFIFVIASPSQRNGIYLLVEMQIFFREFKDQLHKYLNIHRDIWEQIAVIKEMHHIKGKEVGNYKSSLEKYKKTIDLIQNRINQMSTYAGTRASLSKMLSVEQPLKVLFQYRFEDLFNTLAYIKEIWNITVGYVNNAIRVLGEIDAKASMSGIRSIQILASVGVVTGVLGYLARDSLPKISTIGAGYLIALGIIAYIVDIVLRRIAKNKKYKIKFIERKRDI